MIKFLAISRRRLLASLGAALAFAAVPLKRVLAHPSSVRTRPRVDLDRGAHAIPDYARNPFLRPVGLPFSAQELARPTPPPQRRRGLGEDES